MPNPLNYDPQGNNGQGSYTDPTTGKTYNTANVYNSGGQHYAYQYDNPSDPFGYNTPSGGGSSPDYGYDPNNIREQVNRTAQSRIDAINAYYNNLVSNQKTSNQASENSTAGVNLRGGLAGSDFGTANANQSRDASKAKLDTIESARNSEIQNALNGVETDYNARIKSAQEGVTFSTEQTQKMLDRGKDAIATLASNPSVTLDALKADPVYGQLQHLGMSTTQIESLFNQARVPKLNEKYVPAANGKTELYKYGVDASGKLTEQHIPLDINYKDFNPDNYTTAATGDGRIYLIPKNFDPNKSAKDQIILAGETKTTSNDPLSPAGKEYADYVTNQKSLNEPYITFDQYQTRDANRKAAIAKAGVGGSGIDSVTMAKVLQVANQFDGEAVVKNYNVISEGYNFAKSLSNTTTNPGDDQGLIYAFAKIMDPNSVVREGEYATVQKYSQSWAQKFGFDVARLYSNSPFLTSEARKNMKATIDAKYQASEKNYKNIYGEYGRRINKITGKTDGTDYITDYSKAYSGDNGTPGGAGDIEAQKKELQDAGYSPEQIQALLGQ